MTHTHPYTYESLLNSYEKLKRKETYLKIINDFIFSLNDLYTEEDVVWAIAKNVIAQMKFVDCVVYIVNEKRDGLVQRAAHGPKNPEKLDILNPIIVPMGEGIVGTVAMSGKSEIVHDVRLDKRYIVDDASRLSEISVPIIHDGQVIGVIDSEHPQEGFYTQEHLDILTTVAAMSATKIMQARAFDELKHHQDNLERQVKAKTAALEETVAELRRSNQDLEGFAYAASHDLKEPLRTITSFLQLIERREGERLSKASKEDFEFVVDGAKRMNHLLSGLLAYSRIRRSDIVPEIVDINHIMDVVMANLSAKIKARKAVIVYENLHKLEVNRTQIIQLFQNLIDNAIKFTKEEESPQIHVFSLVEGNHVVFKIADNGIGLAAENQDRIFGLFTRANAIGEYEGSGIGLALCKRIVETHKGFIRVASELGKGTTFYCSFPSTL